MGILPRGEFCASHVLNFPNSPGSYSNELYASIYSGAHAGNSTLSST